MTVRILKGDCREVLQSLPDESAHCVVTSPPYWGLRDYGTGNCGIGLEETLDEHIDALVCVFRAVRRVLRADGTVWLNYGDAYAGSWGAQGRGDKRSEIDARNGMSAQQIAAHPKRRQTGSLARTGGCKAKDLMGLPWMLAFALRADGWYLRQDIIWSKPNPMPESVQDRCTKGHEYIFLLSKSARYFYDAAAIAEESVYKTGEGGHQRFGKPGGKAEKEYGKQVSGEIWNSSGTRNKRSVWEIPTAPYADAHFATFPPALIEPCILAGCPAGGTVLDPFGGAGTTGLVADRLGRNAILIELNPEYAEMAERRIKSEAGMFATVANG